MSAERAAILRDIALFHGWGDFHDSGADAYSYVAQQAVEREMHMSGVSAYLEYLKP